jgi:hypothetical protein
VKFPASIIAAVLWRDSDRPRIAMHRQVNAM